MKAIIKITIVVLVLTGGFSIRSNAWSETYSLVPLKMQAALFLKIFVFNNNINKGGDVTIHIMDAPEFAAEMRKSIGIDVGKSKLVAVNDGSDLPAEKPTVIYIGDPTKLENITRYTRSNKILSITGIPDLVAKGVTLGMGVSSKKSKILLNISSSKAEGVNWNPAILKISTMIK